MFVEFINKMIESNYAYVIWTDIQIMLEAHPIPVMLLSLNIVAFIFYVVRRAFWG